MNIKAAIRRLLQGYLKLCQQAGHCDCFRQSSRSTCCSQQEG